MPRKYKRKTDRGAPPDVLLRAMEKVLSGTSIRSAASDFGIARMTLKRFIDSRKGNIQSTADFGYANCRSKNMIFTPKMETELALHIKNLAQQFHGLTRNKCRTLIVEFAIRNSIDVPESWIDNKMAGEHFWISFKERNGLAIRAPEATSLARASAFNPHTVGKFFDNLGRVLDTHKFEAQDIYYVDETGCTTVSQPEKIVAALGVKQVGSVTSAERGQLVTVVSAVNAAGSVVPPMLIFPRKNFKEYFIKGGPAGCVGRANPSGWINEQLFQDYLQHFIKHTRCTLDKKVLLIFDNHEAHISLSTIDVAKENGIVLLTLPPHTSHKLQPLDVSCFKPFKTAYSRAMDNWMRSNPGKTLTIYEIPELVTHAQMHGLVAKNIVSGFRATGIFPFNKQVFNEADFAGSAVTDREVISNDVSGHANLQTNVIAQPVTALSSATNSAQPSPVSEQPETPISSVAVSSTSFAIQLQNVSEQSNPPSPQPGPSSMSSSQLYVSPSDIIPLPKAGPRKNSNRGRKRGETLILTDTPVRNQIESENKQKNAKKIKLNTAKKNLFTPNIDTEDTSEDSGSSKIEYSDSSDDFDEFAEDDEIIEGDFVVVKILSEKLRNIHYIARVDVIEKDECEGVFLQRVFGKQTQISFILNNKDVAFFPKTDIIKKLPAPKQLGGTARTSSKLVFPCDFTKWEFHRTLN